MKSSTAGGSYADLTLVYIDCQTPL